jgi:hypothetical protein
MTKRGWQALVDRGLRAAVSSGERPTTAESLLDSVGIFSWAPYRQQALTYASDALSDEGKRTGGAS